MRKIVYIDMDNVLVNFQSGIDRLPENLNKNMKGDWMMFPVFLD
jgi:hypothetical protein